jgi:hypothetical protein
MRLSQSLQARGIDVTEPEAVAPAKRPEPAPAAAPYVAAPDGGSSGDGSGPDGTPDGGPDGGGGGPDGGSDGDGPGGGDANGNGDTNGDGNGNGHDDEGPLGFSLLLTNLHDKRKKHVLSQPFLEGELFQKYAKLRERIQGHVRPPYEIRHKDRTYQLETEEELLADMEAAGQKGLKIQRYKGLGEMNAPQLWDTTMDPRKRTFLKVRIQDVLDADDIFTTLMGGNVEPRRGFIQENALNVRELDI